jgi:putative hydrolase of the HAD superfamily
MKTSTRTITTVVFDAVGTLIVPDPAASVVYARAARRFGSRVDEATVAIRLRKAIVDEFESLGKDGETTSSGEELERWRRVVRRVFAELPSAGEELFRELWTYFADPRHWRVDAAAADVWRSLRSAGLRIAIASNFDERLESICSEHELLSDVDGLFHSAALGYRKPAVAFFHAVAARLHAAPHQLLMVGDSVTADYQGARSAGWHALLIGASNQVLADGHVERLELVPRWLERYEGASKSEHWDGGGL